MKNLNLKKVRFAVISVVGIIACVAGFAFFSTSSSRILLKDQEKIDKVLLHNEVGTHDCHCYVPKIATNPGFQISKITSTSATFRYVCDVAASYQVMYGLTNAKGDTFPKKRPTAYYTDYSVTVTGLKPNTTYHAGPMAWEKAWPKPKTWLMEDRAQNDWTFKTLTETAVLPENVAAPVSNIAITDVITEKITTREASIRWKTNGPSTSQVEYGTTKAYGSISGENTEMVTDHYIQLFDLTPGTTYYFRVVSKGLSKGPTYSSDYNLTTQKFEKKIADKESYFIEPNPASVKTEFNYYLFQNIDNLTIDILTLSGKKMAVLEAPKSSLNTGWNRISWDLKDHASKPLVNGLYVYVMKFNKGKSTEVCQRSQFMVRR